jgi:hypothetical protein
VAIGLLLPIPDDCAVGEAPAVVVGVRVARGLTAAFEELRANNAISNAVKLEIRQILLKGPQRIDVH